MDRCDCVLPDLGYERDKLGSYVSWDSSVTILVSNGDAGHGLAPIRIPPLILRILTLASSARKWYDKDFHEFSRLIVNTMCSDLPFGLV